MGAPIRTAEHKLLTELAEGKRAKGALNQRALADALASWYVITLGDYAIITDDGLTRLDKLQD